ncbi:MAG TPA: hypothetical protein VLA99_16115 [Nitrospiraceae bacterium]|nr:hypothetical protein [Nitrospiraceae bacterium]
MGWLTKGRPRRLLSLPVVVLMVFIGLWGLMAGQAGAQSGGLTHDPTEILKRYFTLDSKGARLESLSYETVAPYVAWKDEPVWGHAVVIEDFKVIDETSQWEIVNNLEVVIPVEFKVLGLVYYEKAVFIPEPGPEVVRVRVKAVRNRWRIVEPVLPPHIGHKRMINHVRQAWLDETDLAKREQLDALREAIRKAK